MESKSPYRTSVVEEVTKNVITLIFAAIFSLIAAFAQSTQVEPAAVTGPPVSIEAMAGTRGVHYQAIINEVPVPSQNGVFQWHSWHSSLEKGNDARYHDPGTPDLQFN